MILAQLVHIILKTCMKTIQDNQTLLQYYKITETIKRSIFLSEYMQFI